MTLLTSLFLAFQLSTASPVDTLRPNGTPTLAEQNKALRAGRWQAAVRIANTQRQHGPDVDLAAQYESNACTALIAMDRHAAALARCDAALAHRARSWRAHLNRGVALAGLGRYEAARAAYRTAVRYGADPGVVAHNRALLPPAMQLSDAGSR